MKKVIIYTLIFITLIIGFTYVSNSEKYIQTMFIMNLDNGDIQQVGNKKYNVDNIEWSADSKSFIFVNHKTDTLKAPHIERLMFFNISEIKKSTQIASSWSKEVSCSFLSNDLILISKWGSIGQRQYQLYDLKSHKIYKTQHGDIYKYIPTEYARAVSPWNMYDIPGEISARIRTAAGSDYFQAVVNYNKDKVIFSTKDYKTYELDLLTGKSKFIFNGFQYNLSRHGTKVAYFVPKAISFEEFNLEEGGQAEDFITYVYDLEAGTSTKVADFAAKTYFSYDDKHMILYKSGHVGGKGEM